LDIIVDFNISILLHTYDKYNYVSYDCLPQWSHIYTWISMAWINIHRKKGCYLFEKKLIMNWTCTILTRRVPKVEQELFTLLEAPLESSIFSCDLIQVYFLNISSRVGRHNSIWKKNIGLLDIYMFVVFICYGSCFQQCDEC
jgi:hypothetical protein